MRQSQSQHTTYQTSVITVSGWLCLIGCPKTPLAIDDDYFPRVIILFPIKVHSRIHKLLVNPHIFRSISWPQRGLSGTSPDSLLQRKPTVFAGRKLKFGGEKTRLNHTPHINTLCKNAHVNPIGWTFFPGQVMDFLCSDPPRSGSIVCHLAKPKVVELFSFLLCWRTLIPGERWWKVMTISAKNKP